MLSVGCETGRNLSELLGVRPAVSAHGGVGGQIEEETAPGWEATGQWEGSRGLEEEVLALDSPSLGMNWGGGDKPQTSSFFWVLWWFVGSHEPP